MYPDDLKYTSEHEWARAEGDRATIGITHYAQDALGDIVYVDIPAVGTAVTGGETFGEVESTKSVSDVYAPVAGVVAAVNESLTDAPDTINADPYGAGWLVEITVPGDGDPTGALLDAAAYQALVEAT
jgi:glycine cleavage system H protein